jgi:hypothetical protein
MINSIHDNIDIIGLIFSALSLLISSLIYFITYRTYNAQFEQIKKQKLPNFRILSIEFNKSHPDSSNIYDGKYCIIYKGYSSNDIELNKLMATFKSDDEQIETGFIEEIESHLEKTDVYFTYYGTKPYLIANHTTAKDKFIIEHSNTKITLHNYGAIISTLSIESLTVSYSLDMDKKDLFFHGIENNKITLSPDQNKEFVLFFDEVTTGFNDSLCETPFLTYNTLSDSFDLLKVHMPQNILTYNKMELIFSCWDLYNNKHRLQITIEYNGNFFISTTTILK